MKLSFSFIICLIVLVFLTSHSHIFAQSDFSIETIEPPSWWTNMDYNEIQLIVYGKNIITADPQINSPDLEIKKIHRTENRNYLFIDLLIKADAKPGIYEFLFFSKNDKITISYELKARDNSQVKWQGFDSSDAIYLLMPDRFANGDPTNDTKEGMLEKADRSNPDGRHGGDIAGIVKHLDYIVDMGFTTLWINPLIENNRPDYSYHGYGLTDFYQVDPRFGTNKEYHDLIKEAHSKGLKVVIDMIFNHCDTSHYTISDPPVPDWVNQWENFTRSNFRGEVKTDMYASEYDSKRMDKGWFDTFMADLNLSNPFVSRYLIQNSIWWIEYLGVDAIRMDTYPYPDKTAMAEWADTILALYPDFTILGEIWLQKPFHTSYWQTGNNNFDQYDSHVPVITDFPLHYAITNGLNEDEGWTEGLRKIYYIISEDYLYPDPQNLVVFPDNHDVNRYYTSLGENLDKYKLGLAFILTAPRIPEIYYGTEILMTGEEHKGHGFIRQDFPGGWDSDLINAFTGMGLNDEQADAQVYLKKLLNWRKNAQVIHSGKMKHFIPEDNIYVYFRYNDEESVMVILNSNQEEKELVLDRFREGIEGYSSAHNVINNTVIKLEGSILVPAKSPMILELKK